MTDLPNPFTDSGARAFPSDEAAACLPSLNPEHAAADLSVSPGDEPALYPRGESEPSVMLASPPGESDIPDDLKQRFLAAIEADYRVHIVDLEKLEAALYAPPDVREDTFEQHIAKLDELIDEQPMPIFMQRTG